MSGEPEHGEVLARIDQIGHPIYQPSLKVQGRLCLKVDFLLSPENTNDQKVDCWNDLNIEPTKSEFVSRDVFYTDFINSP